MLLEALFNLLTLSHLYYLFSGVLLGIGIGILPGLGGIVGFSVMLPFLYSMEPTSALALMIGLVAVIPTSDTFTSVLMGIPGSSSSQATVLDGYPLSKQGQAARALGAAFSSSLIGGILGAMILTVMIVFAQSFILSLGSVELFLLGVLGLSMVGVLSGDHLVKGILACGVGLLLGSVGSAPATGEWRMTFGSYYLFDGMKLVIVGLGIFAVPEIVDLLVKNRRIAKTSVLGHGWLQGIKDTFTHKWIVARCAPLGALIGAIPGLGGSIVDWIAYGHVVQIAKDKSRFGKGDIRGVIAPESANNAKEGGGLVPTLLFGIPGSGSMAIFLGGLTILGIEAGPNLVTDQLDVSYTIIWSLALANVLGTGICIFLSGPISKVTTIPYGFLAPFMIMVITFAAFQATRSLEDLVLLLAIGSIGILFKFFNWSRPALLVGFVLSGTVETYLYQAVQFYSWSTALNREGVVIIGIFIVTSIVVSIYFGKKARSKPKVQEPETKEIDELTMEEDEFSEHEKNTYTIWSGEVLFLIGVLGFALYSFVDSYFHSFLGGVFPTSVSVVMIFSSVFLGYQLFSPKSQARVLFRPILSKGKISPTWKDTWKNFLWLVGLSVATWLIGYLPAISLIFIAIIRVKTKSSWLKVFLITALGVGFLFLVQNIMVLHLPTGIVFDLF